MIRPVQAAAFVVILSGLSGCGLIDTLNDLLGEPEPPNCEDRQPYYPDADSDGLGESTAVYIGCEAPEGWVNVLGPEPDSDSATEPDSDSATEPDSDSATEPDSDSATEPDSDSATEPDSDTSSDGDTDSDTDSGTSPL